MRQRVHEKDGMVQVYPTTRGWTVRALYWRDPPYKGFRQKLWTGIKEPPIADHRLTDVKRTVQEALEWLESETNT